MPRNLQTGVTGDLSTDAPGDRKTALAGTGRVPGFSGKKVKGKPGSETPPVFTTAPAIIGSPSIGTASSYTPGTVTGSPTPTVTREWLLDGAIVSTAATYTPVATGTLVMRETASNAAGAAVSVSAGSSVASLVLAWQFSDGATLNTGGANSTIALATGVPVGATLSASPDLLPGQTIQQSGTTLNLVGDSTVPTVNSNLGSAIDAVSDRDIYIEVMDSPYARARNLRYPLVYWGHDEPADTIGGLPEGHARLANVLSPEFGTTPCISGDIIEISPGAVASSGQGTAYDGTGSYLHITTSVTLRNMASRGRWRIIPVGSFGDTTSDGITIHRPGAAWGGERITAVIEGLESDNLGQNVSPVVLRHDSLVPGSWATFVQALTMRNFKLGTVAGRLSLSGITGEAETLLLEDGHLYDLGDGAGQEHNCYVSARNMTMRGVRSDRTRGGLDGHLAKTTFNNGTFEGCVFDSGPLGDNSINLQAKGGGNLVVRGCLFISSPYVLTATGAIVYEKEQGDQVPGNYGGWTYGLSGHSLLVERNVFINHLPAASRGMVYLRPSSSSNYIDTALISSCVIRDNIAMSTAAATSFVQNPPPVYSGTWAANGNDNVTYASNETGFDNKSLKLYTRTGGATASAAGSLTLKRFVWPHGYIARTDVYRGLS